MRDDSRRDFVKAMAVCLVAMNIPRPLTALAAARDTGAISLDPAQWRCLEALCAEIIPTDREPGAREAGCVNFIDKALAAEDAAALPLYQAALGEIDRLSRDADGRVFADLSADVRRSWLETMDRGAVTGWALATVRPQDFFATLRFHTLLGFIADPKYGGNRDYVGWKLMGFPGPLHQVGGVTPAQMLGHEPVVPVWQATPAGSHGGH